MIYAPFFFKESNTCVFNFETSVRFSCEFRNLIGHSVGRVFGAREFFPFFRAPHIITHINFQFDFIRLFDEISFGNHATF